MYIQSKKGFNTQGYIGQGASYRMAPGTMGCPSCLGAAPISFVESLGAVEPTAPGLKLTDLIVPALIGGAVLLLFRATLKQGKRDYRKIKKHARITHRALRKTRTGRTIRRAGRALRRAWG
jgi:hypothetical protein